MRNTIEKIIITIALALIVYAIFITVNNALTRRESAECLKWQTEAEQYEGYYLLEWQISQCQTLNIPVNIK